jgi:methylenetetrahydrofolate dehydrogenase (NADP+) / methenyltetrahydrofolate cyclohydrolase
MQILNGKNVSEKILSDLKNELEKFSKKPVLDIILVGDDPASLQYDEMKQKRAKSIGIDGQIHHLSKNSTTKDVLKKIEELNQNKKVTAFMIQLPVPKQIDTPTILNAIDPKKDADGLTSINLGLLFQRDKSAIASATPLGVIKLLREYNIDLVGKNAVIIGRSPFIGLPLSALFLRENATVTICHSYTKNLKKICQKADILVSCVGRQNFITKDFVKKNAVVIDIGLSPDQKTGKLVGDVDFKKVSKKSSFITPVPGGIGPMTIASLISNTVDIFKKQIKN